MCGIAGVVTLGGQGALPGIISQMTERLKHRGPDDEGFALFTPDQVVIAGGEDTPAAVWQRRNGNAPQEKIAELSGTFQVALGHRRLAIIGLGPDGHQPFCSADRNLWLIFNGEIYNYQSLRAELQQLGVSFQTDTDTEVVLAAYQTWGEDCQLKFNGMWALAIYDQQHQKLYLSRDRFGVKPLYYYHGNGFFAFASEQKALVKLPYVQTGINPVAAFDYLALGQFNPAENLFQNIQELAPSFSLTLEVASGQLTQRRYYTLLTTSQIAVFKQSQADQYIQEVKEKVKAAVRSRLLADVPVGACLSGGLDSSAIVGLMQEIQSQDGKSPQALPTNVFTAGFPGAAIDESHWAKQVVDATNATWHRVFPEADGLVNQLEELVYAQDVPFFNSSTYAQFAVMQKVKEAGFAVTLDGQGADELFAGYWLHNAPVWWELAKTGRWQALWAEMRQGEVRLSGVKSLAAQVGKNLLRKNAFLFSQTAAYTQGPEWRFLNPDFVAQQSKAIAGKTVHPLTSLNHTLSDYFTGWYLQMLLRTADRNSMWASVESRTPFVDDHELVEYVFGVPSGYKLHNGQSKYLLRESMRGLIPEPVRTRKDKIGFATPESAWLPEMKDQLRQYITPDLNEFINTDALLQNWDATFAAASRGGTLRLWRIINFAVWKKVYGL